MGTITGLTAARMEEIEDASVVDGNVDGSGHLILTTHGGSDIDAGYVVGPVALTGTVIMYAGSSAPTDWLICDGSAISRTTYSDLFSVIGTDYGVGNGTTTFNIPNLKGKVPVGLDSGQT